MNSKSLQLCSRAWISILLMWVFSGASAQVDLFDDFERPDGQELGNNWISKNPGSYQLINGEVQKLPVTTSFQNNAVYRPAGEDVLNVETSIEFNLTGSVPGYPQLFVRGQSATIANNNNFRAYLFFVNNGGQAILRRQMDNNYTNFSSFLIGTLNNTDTYRLRLSAEGTDPVVLNAFFERQSGESWDMINQRTYSDSSAARISTAGTVGFSGYIEGGYNYDNFTRTNLDTGVPDNPPPVLGGIAPEIIAAGGVDFELTVTGYDFTAASVVRWNGADRNTSFISNLELRATITAADIALAATADVTVSTPVPGGGVSNSASFTVEPTAGINPLPVASQLSPDTMTEGTGPVTLTVNGSNFVNGASVRWNGADRTTTFVSTTTLQATIQAADLTTAGIVPVTVFNPAPGGGLSGSLDFVILEPVADNPLPTLSNLLPSQVDAGGNALTLLLSGTDFVADSVVRINGADRSTTYLSETQLEAAITTGDIAAPGTLSVSVFNPAPGGGGSGPLMLTINDPNAGTNPQPVLDRTEPVSALAGSIDINLTVYGAAFTPDSEVRWNGATLTTSYIDTGTLQAVIPASLMTNNTIATITVATPAPGGGGTLPQSFFVLQAGEDLFYDNFNRADNAAIGNNWVEKSPDDFSLLNGNAVSVESDGYHDSIVYRPTSEALLNMETGFEFTRMPDADRFPQLHARIGPDTVELRGTLHSYLFFYNDFADRDGLGPQAIFAIQAPVYQEYECYIAALPMPAYFVTGERYRMRFRVTGVNPVVLTGFIEQFNGASWNLLASGSTTHDATTQTDPDLYCDPDNIPSPIIEAGTAGFSKWIDPSDQYDNFYRIALIDEAIPPFINALVPGSAQTGDADFLLTVQGQFFTPDSVILWNGMPRISSFVSTGTLTTTISAADIQSAGTVPVSVETPGIAASAAINFSIVDPAVNPVPVAVSLSPSSAYVGNPDLTLTVNGNDFTPESVVRWDGEDQATGFISDSSLQITVPASDMILAGTADIAVFTPAPGGGTSATLVFSILEPVTAGFFDDFNRADGALPGNGWIVKTPASYSLIGGTVQKQAVSSGYQNNLVYRPAAEDVLDVEASVEFTLSGPSPGYPQLFVRGQSGTIAGSNILDAYLFCVYDTSGQAVLRRQTGNGYSTLSYIPIGNLNNSDTYRLRLRAEGTNPVVLNAYLERRTGGNWDIINQSTYYDGGSSRIDTEGTVGFSGYIEAGYRYDNFTRTLITGE